MPSTQKSHEGHFAPLRLTTAYSSTYTRASVENSLGLTRLPPLANVGGANSTHHTCIALPRSLGTAGRFFGRGRDHKKTTPPRSRLGRGLRRGVALASRLETGPKLTPGRPPGQPSIDTPRALGILFPRQAFTFPAPQPGNCERFCIRLLCTLPLAQQGEALPTRRHPPT
jgi:hypothetical protein